MKNSNIENIYKNIYHKKSNLPFVPYTYVITHIKSGKRYYGAKFSKGAHPDTFFKTYFSSSKTIHLLLSIEGISSFNFEIRKTFKDSTSCLLWEQKVLRRLHVDKNNNWINIDYNQKHNNNSNTICISNIEKNVCIRFPKTLDIPSGWVKGNITTKNKKITHKNKKWYHDKNTNESFFVEPQFKLSNWVEGRGKTYKTNSDSLKQYYSEKIWITDGIYSKIVNKIEPIPENWYLGRTISIWITNGTINKKINIIKENYTIPQNYYIGKTKIKSTYKRDTGYSFITNGNITKKLFNNEILPEGFYYKLKSKNPKKNVKKIYINNSKITKKHYIDTPIPEGWSKGMVKNENKKKYCKISLFKNINNNEIKYFSSNIKETNIWKKYNPGQFLTGKQSLNKGKIAIKNILTNKLAYIFPEKEIPENYVLYKSK